MKKIIVLFFISIIPLHAQSYVIEYIYNRTNGGDSNKISKLYIHKHQSYYQIIDTLQVEDKKNESFDSFQIQKKKDFNRFNIKDWKKDSLFSFYQLEHSGKTYIVTQKIPNFHWELVNESKTVLNYPCKKAVGNYKNRKFTAWFTTDIPISEGPWKFNGLPGLILEVASDDNFASFIANEVSTRKEIAFPKTKKMEKISFEDYLIEAKKDIQAYRKYFTELFAAMANGKAQITAEFTSEDIDYVIHLDNQ